MSMRELDQKLKTYVETIAVRAKYNLFFERGDMQKIVEQPPSKHALAVREVLSGLGFNTTFVGQPKMRSQET